MKPKLEMQSVHAVALMADARRPRAVRQVAIRVEDVDEKKEHGVEHYFMKLIWTAKLHGMFFSPRARRGVWITNLTVNFVVLVIISMAIFIEVNLVLDAAVSFDMEISTMLCSIFWTFESVISMAFLIWWQLSGRLWEYLENVVLSQRGEAISQGSAMLKRTLYLAHVVNIILISIVIIVHHGPEGLSSEFNKHQIFTNVFVKPLHSFSIIHIMTSSILTIFMYNILVDGCYLEAKHFNQRVLKLKADSDRELSRELADLVVTHSRIARNIRQLDGLFKVYAFVMVATVIPSTLLNLNMLAQRVEEYIDFLFLGLPSIGIIMTTFLGITLAPARLYEEMYRSKNYLCQNGNIWHPHKQEVYQLAMVLSSHMEQPNLGLSIWGFAILSKPFILATFSVMIMVLSLVIEIVPTIQEFVEDFEEKTLLLTNSTDMK